MVEQEPTESVGPILTKAIETTDRVLATLEERRKQALERRRISEMIASGSMETKSWRIRDELRETERKAIQRIKGVLKRRAKRLLQREGLEKGKVVLPIVKSPFSVFYRPKLGDKCFVEIYHNGELYFCVKHGPRLDKRRETNIDARPEEYLRLAPWIESVFNLALEGEIKVGEVIKTDDPFSTSEIHLSARI